MSRRKKTRKGGCLRCGTTEWASIRKIPAGCSACSNACMEETFPALASVWRFVRRLWNARAGGFGWIRKPGGALPSSSQFLTAVRISPAPVRKLKMGNSDQNRAQGDEIERLRKALDAETRASIEVRRQLDRVSAEFEEFVSMAAHNLREPLRDVA